MKKIFSSILVCVMVVSVVLCFAACKTKPTGDTTTTTTQAENAASVNKGYAAEVNEDSVKIYKDEVLVQELTYPDEKLDNFVLDFARNHVAFKDMNFDGELDICLAVDSLENGFNYCCWIFDTESGEFVYNKTLSDFTSITIDNVNKQLVSTEKNDGELVYVIYEWKNGELKKLEEKEELPETVTDNVIGAVTSSNTTSKNPANAGSSGNSSSSGSGSNQQGGSSSGNSGSSGSSGSSGGSSSGGSISYGPDQFANTWY